MAINVSDLPPEYQAQAFRKWKAQQCRETPSQQMDVGAPPNTKYHNKPTERITPSGAVLRFQSRKEARRYDYLIRLEQIGQIRDLRLQVDFTLQEAYTDTEGRRVRAIRYKADFTYYRPPGTAGTGSHAAYWAEQSGAPWVLVVEDAKSRPTKTKTYAMKRKMLKDRFGLDIVEV
ncbi:MAG: DUF1064 domain-containing protein [Intestinimonas sp.]|jgi:hypothetical protein|nr:DUF1064 domain-containing protein [Intestinimonas sp.]